MAKITHPTGQLSGFILPWDLYDATDPNNGLLTDYTEADSEFGQVITDSNLKIIASGTPASGITSLSTYATQSGMPDGDACGVIVSETATASTDANALGRDRVTQFTGYKNVVNSATVAGQQICALDDGTIVMVYGRLSGTDYVFVSRYRDPDTGVWSPSVSATTITTTPQGPLLQPVIGCCVVPDGAVHAYIVTSADGGLSYTISCYRSTDLGVTWALQRSNVDVSSLENYRFGPSANPTHNWPFRLRAASGGGSVVLMVTTGRFETGGGTDDIWFTRQFASTDGGFTFTYIGEEGGGSASSLDQRLTEDLQWIGGAYMAVFSNGNRVHQTAQVFGTANQYAYRDSYLSTDNETVNSDAPLGAGACIIWDGITNPCVLAKQGLQPYVSPNFGSNWLKVLDSKGVSNSLNSMGFDYPTSARSRDKIIVIANLFDDSSSPTRATLATQGGSHFELVFGGNTNFNVGTEISGFNQMYLPLQDIANVGFTLTGTAAPYALTYNAIRFLDTGTAIANYTYGLGVEPTAVGYYYGVVKCTVQNLEIFCTVPETSVRFVLTPTAYKFYDENGTVPSATTHGISDFIEFFIVVDAVSKKATLRFRDYSIVANPKIWTTEVSITSINTAPQLDHQFGFLYSAGDDFSIAAFGTQSGRSSPTEFDVASDPTQINPIPLSIASPSYADNGVYLTAKGGPAIRGDTHTIPVSSPYQKANMLPDFAPSPRDYWKSNTPASDMDLIFKVNQTSDPVYSGSSTIGIYLTGLKGCSTMTVDLGSFSTSTTLTQELYWDTRGKTQGRSIKIPLSILGTAPAPWVSEGELVGGEVIIDQVYTIVANTSGSLSYSLTKKKTCTITLDRDVSGAITPGATVDIRVCPPRFLICLTADSFTTDEISTVKLSIPNGTPYQVGVNRQIGTAAIGPIRFLGRGVDRKTAFVTDTGREIIDLPNGARSMVERKPNRRRQEIAIVDTAIDITQLRRFGGTPDYVVLDSANDFPAAERYGDPLILEGLYQEWAGKPIVWLPSIPSSDTDATSGGPGYARDALYGRITSESYRREWAGVGKHGQTEMYRVPTLVIEEEI